MAWSTAADDPVIVAKCQTAYTTYVYLHKIRIFNEKKDC